MNSDDIFTNLRQKLDVLGYNQPLPLSAISLVGALFEDLIKTTESLRDAKSQIGSLLEEKSCWELGVEPYKCDNSRLLAETNRLQIELIRQKEDFEERILTYSRKIRNLESDKRILEDHCAELENQIRNLTVKFSDSKSLKNKKDGSNMSKKPFISTVRTGCRLSNPITESRSTSKCTKCNSIVWTKSQGGNSAENDRLQDVLRDKNDEILLYKKKVEDRDREIRRLSDLLVGGRPASALAKDCCYKNVGTLSEDVEQLQREKAEYLRNLRDIQDAMHEAKQRAVQLAEINKKLEQDLNTFKETALHVEEEANKEIAKKELEIQCLKKEFMKQNRHGKYCENRREFSHDGSSEEKRRLNERINELVLRERELLNEVDRLSKKNIKLKTKLLCYEKESADKCHKVNKTADVDEALIRLKSERDLFQKEYLRLVEKTGNNTEICCLKTQLRDKDEELRNLRTELCQLRAQNTSRYSNQDRGALSSTSSSVQAAILRAERERDIYKSDLERVKEERDTLRERLQSCTEAHIKATNRLEEEIEELNLKISKLKKDNHEIISSQIPGQTHLVLLKEESEELKKRILELQSENSKLNANYNQLKILHEQTERALVEYQNKLVTAETNLRNAESRLCSLDSNRESTRNENSALRNEIAVLKANNSTLEHEKDKVMADLDEKTERVYKLESELKILKKKKQDLESSVHELQSKLDKRTSEKKIFESELHETSTESKTLRQQLSALKETRDKALAENSRLTNELSDAQAEIALVKRKLKDCEKEVESLKNQLQQYVHKVQRAEDLLLQKEREREEMLEHYRHLSHDAIVLEGNNQSLEIEAAENKRQLCDAEEEISKLKQELCTKECVIQKYEKQVSTLSTKICSLETELDQAYDDQKLLKADLDAVKELCDKLDLQCEKQNAELKEKGDVIAKLEKENSELRRNVDSGRPGDKAAGNVLQDLLAETRSQLDMERKAYTKLKAEYLETKRQCEEVKDHLSREKEKAEQKEALATEYRVQLQEIQHNMTDDRFNRARSREESPRSSKRIVSNNQKSSPTRRSNPKSIPYCRKLEDTTTCDQFKKKLVYYQKQACKYHHLLYKDDYFNENDEVQEICFEEEVVYQNKLSQKKEKEKNINYDSLPAVTVATVSTKSSATTPCATVNLLKKIDEYLVRKENRNDRKSSGNDKKNITADGVKELNTESGKSKEKGMIKKPSKPEKKNSPKRKICRKTRSYLKVLQSKSLGCSGKPNTSEISGTEPSITTTSPRKQKRMSKNEKQKENQSPKSRSVNFGQTKKLYKKSEKDIPIPVKKDDHTDGDTRNDNSNNKDNNAAEISINPTEEYISTFTFSGPTTTTAETSEREIREQLLNCSSEDCKTTGSQLFISLERSNDSIVKEDEYQRIDDHNMKKSSSSFVYDKKRFSSTPMKLVIDDQGGDLEGPTEDFEEPRFIAMKKSQSSAVGKLSHQESAEESSSILNKSIEERSKSRMEKIQSSKVGSEKSSNSSRTKRSEKSSKDELSHIEKSDGISELKISPVKKSSCVEPPEFCKLEITPVEKSSCSPPSELCKLEKSPIEKSTCSAQSCKLQLSPTENSSWSAPPDFRKLEIGPIEKSSCAAPPELCKLELGPVEKQSCSAQSCKLELSPIEKSSCSAPSELCKLEKSSTEKSSCATPPDFCKLELGPIEKSSCASHSCKLEVSPIEKSSCAAPPELCKLELGPVEKQSCSAQSCKLEQTPIEKSSCSASPDFRKLELGPIEKSSCAAPPELCKLEIGPVEKSSCSAQSCKLKLSPIEKSSCAGPPDFCEVKKSISSDRSKSSTKKRRPKDISDISSGGKSRSRYKSDSSNKSIEPKTSTSSDNIKSSTLELLVKLNKETSSSELKTGSDTESIPNAKKLGSRRFERYSRELNHKSLIVVPSEVPTLKTKAKRIPQFDNCECMRPKYDTIKKIIEGELYAKKTEV